MVIFKQHALRQLAGRQIRKEEVLWVLNKPDKLSKQPTGRWLAARKWKRAGKDYLIIVVFEEKGSDQEVVTAFYTSKIKKYL